MLLDDYVSKAIEHVDIYMIDYLEDISSRREKGIGFFYSVVDASLNLYTGQVLDEAPPSSLTSALTFALPFTGGLWGCIMLIVGMCSHVPVLYKFNMTD